MIVEGKKYLITTDNWFFAPNGETYRAAWGTCKLLSTEEVFSFKPSRPSTNWYMVVGSGDREISIAGCQIHYAVRCDNRPHDVQLGKTYTDKDTGLEHPASRIYFADPEVTQ